MRAFALALCLSLATSPLAAAYRLIPASQPVAVGSSNMQVTPPIAWNKLPRRTGKKSEAWTLDGLNLNELNFFAAIGENETLVREVDKRNRPMPRFAAAMLPPDVLTLYETTLRNAAQTASYTTTSVEPATFLGSQGFKFSYRYTLQDEVSRKGEGIGAVIGGKLYLITFNAAETHYFDRDVAHFRRIVATARLGGARP